MSLIIAKFGGTSMGSAEAINQVAEIVSNIKEPKAVVVSAVAKVTDQLLNLGQLALSGRDFQMELNQLIKRHDEIIAGLGINLNLQPFYDELRTLLQGVSLLRELSLCKKDHLVSFGERMSSLLLAEKLKSLGYKSERVDSRTIVMTDENYTEASVDFAKTNQLIKEKLRPMIQNGVIPVITGFIGQSPTGHYTTLGRGGSDYTGAIIAAGLEATELQIWTDVEGIFSSDPRIIPEARPISQISFFEAGELAYFGAKVLHPKTIIPAVQQNIPVRILNTFNPSAPGTTITNQETESLKAISWKKGITIVNIFSMRSLEAPGFLAKVFEIFARFGISIDVVATSEVSVSLTVDEPLSAKLIQELELFSRVEVLPDHAIMCLVGEGIKKQKGILGELFMTINEHQVDMVSLGSSKRNITWLVKADEAEAVARKVFNRFFNIGHW